MSSGDHVTSWKKLNLVTLQSPSSDKLNDFYNLLHLVVKLPWGLAQSFLLGFAVEQSYLLLGLFLFHPLLDDFQRFPSQIWRFKAPPSWILWPKNLPRYPRTVIDPADKSEKLSLDLFLLNDMMSMTPLFGLASRPTSPAC